MSEERKPVRVYVDGCFDLMHYGHANALRQAAEYGDQLVVGVHTDAEIQENKGPTVMKEQERYDAVRACKWVHEVVEGAPYKMFLSTLEDNNIDFCVHGDDLTLMANGEDCYADVKAAGRYKEVKRTTGVSTTDLVERMLECCRLMDGRTPGGGENPFPVASVHSPYTKSTPFIATSKKIAQFSAVRAPSEEDVVVYIDGAFDVFHPGHIFALREAKALGTFLIVGVFDDDAVNSYKGLNFPLNTLHERVLNVLSCRYVDEVVIAPSVYITADFCNELRISKVVTGKLDDDPNNFDGPDPYAYPKAQGMFEVIDSGSDLTTSAILARVRENFNVYYERNAKKAAKEVAKISELEAQEAGGGETPGETVAATDV